MKIETQALIAFTNQLFSSNSESDAISHLSGDQQTVTGDNVNITVWAYDIDGNCLASGFRAFSY